jgi:hypothetical protein
MIDGKKYSINKNDIRHNLLMNHKGDGSKVKELLTEKIISFDKGFKCDFVENKIFYYKNELPINLLKYFYEEGCVNEDKILLYLSLKDNNYNFDTIFKSLADAKPIAKKQMIFITEKEGSYLNTPIFFYNKKSSTLILYKILLKMKTIEAMIEKYFGKIGKSNVDLLISGVFNKNNANLDIFRFAKIVNLVENLDHKKMLIQQMQSSIEYLSSISNKKIENLLEILKRVKDLKHNEILNNINDIPENLNINELETEYESFHDYLFDGKLKLIEKTITKKDIEFYKIHPFIKNHLMEKIRVNEDLEIEFPSTNIDLEKYSLIMSNCIRGYYQKVSTSCILFGVYNNGSLEYNIELNSDKQSVTQFERIKKTTPKPEIKEIIYNWLKSHNYLANSEK